MSIVVSRAVVLSDAVGRRGWRNVHVMRVGEVVDTTPIFAMIPEEVVGQAGFYAWEEGEAVKRFHLQVWWPVTRPFAPLSIRSAQDIPPNSPQVRAPLVRAGYLGGKSNDDEGGNCG